VEILTVELVPQSMWRFNVRSNVRPKTWDRIKCEVALPADWRCQICRRAGANHPVECHEVWEYDDRRLVQILTGLVPLCPDCHRVKHFGLAMAQNRTRDALVWLCQFNNWTPDQGLRHVAAALQVHKQRSTHEWQLDLSLLTRRYGVRLDANHQEI